MSEETTDKTTEEEKKVKPPPPKPPPLKVSGKDNPIARKIRDAFPAAYISATLFREDLSVEVKKEALFSICLLLRDDPELDFDFPVHISSVDYLREKVRFEVVYEFFSIKKKHQVRIKTRVAEDDCVVDSVTSIWKGANFLEREVYDMMGIRFNNHPDLKRILLPDDYEEGYPLRKDFPVQGRGWRDTFDFPH